MKIANYIIRRVDERNIIVHKDMGKDKRGDYRVDQTAYYYGSLFNAIKKVRQLLVNEQAKLEVDQLIQKLEALDEKFHTELIEAFKSQDIDTLIEKPKEPSKRDVPTKNPIKKTKKKGKKKVYVAGGWFNDKMLATLKEIEDEMIKQSKYDFFLPRLHNCGSEGCDWDKIIQRNIDELAECDYMIASTEGKDMGALVEVGRFQEMKKPVIFYAPGLSGPFNLMLAKEAHRVCTTKEELQDALRDLSKKVPYHGKIE